jgi:hypothetical protein
MTLGGVVVLMDDRERMLTLVVSAGIAAVLWLWLPPNLQ